MSLVLSRTNLLPQTPHRRVHPVPSGRVGTGNPPLSYSMMSLGSEDMKGCCVRKVYEREGKCRQYEDRWNGGTRGRWSDVLASEGMGM